MGISCACNIGWRAVDAPYYMKLDNDMAALTPDAPAVSHAAAHPVTAPSMPEDPLATKLALAKEFSAIGDNEGARALVEEVIAESSGTLKARARQLLAEMD